MLYPAPYRAFSAENTVCTDAAWASRGQAIRAAVTDALLKKGATTSRRLMRYSSMECLRYIIVEFPKYQQLWIQPMTQLTIAEK
jgi:hypothetical protein